MNFWTAFKYSVIIAVVSVFHITTAKAAQISDKQLKKVEQEVFQQSMEHKKLQAQATQIALEISEVSRQMVKTAKQLQNNEEKLSKMEKQLFVLKEDLVKAHDSFNEEDKSIIDNYENSKVFGETIRKIRRHYLDVVIIAGACCSHFEYLIAQGANFASSPGRINTHTYDPAVTAIKVASTSINKTVDFSDIIKYIEGGKEAIGGIQTNGKMRIIYWGIYMIKAYAKINLGLNVLGKLENGYHDL